MVEKLVLTKLILLNQYQPTSQPSVQIVRYAVIPLEPNSGLIEWVPGVYALYIYLYIPGVCVWEGQG